MAVHDGLGLLATGRGYNSSLSLWDLDDDLQLIRKVGPLGGWKGCKFNVEQLHFTTNGALAYLNSNNTDEEPLKIIEPNDKMRVVNI